MCDRAPSHRGVNSTSDLSSFFQRSRRLYDPAQTANQMIRIPKFVLPDSYRSPAHFSQRSVHQFVALPIARQFFLPKIPICPRHRTMTGATVPKASIDEYSKLAGGKNKVRISENPRPPPPSHQAIFSKDLHKPDLGRQIAAAFHPGHNLRSLRACENVRHLSARRNAAVLSAEDTVFLRQVNEDRRVWPGRRLCGTFLPFSPTILRSGSRDA
jgi:hypothetical protein